MGGESSPATPFFLNLELLLRVLESGLFVLPAVAPFLVALQTPWAGGSSGNPGSVLERCGLPEL